MEKKIKLLNFFQNKNPKGVKSLPTSTILKLEAKIFSLLETLTTEKNLRNVSENLEKIQGTIKNENYENSDVSFSEDFYLTFEKNEKNEKTSIKKKTTNSKSESMKNNYFETISTNEFKDFSNNNC